MATTNTSASRGRTGTPFTGKGVPGPLATPSALGAEAIEKVSRTINALLADSFALYVKTKNFHWHLSGPRFHDLHLLFDEQAAEILASTDELAERVRRVGGTTLRSITHISRLQRLPDDEDDVVPALEMVRRLMEDNSAMLASMREAHRICDQAGDIGTVNLLEDLIDQTEKRVWFLFEICQEEDMVSIEPKA